MKIAKCLASTVLEQLSSLEDEQRKGRQIVSSTQSSKQVSPWLELTRWPTYLDGHRLLDVASLVALPHRDSERILIIICQSVDRLVEDAY